ncbi:MAG: ATP-binding protein [Gammaproteobacteria bacterium]|nr:MAG: ATP-binding protein [Gammaproteobacteria bacterium]
MAMTNRERVGKGLELLRDGLAPFVAREFESAYPGKGQEEARRFIGDDRLHAGKPMSEWDAAVLLKVMWEAWNSLFRNVLGFSERSLVSELRDVRNRWAHQQKFSSDDAYRALDSVERLLMAVSAPEAEELGKMKMELLRLRFEEQRRAEHRKTSAVIESPVATSLKPWREVVQPHRDVASGRYQQAEFAADLWQVYLGEGGEEYRDPREFFRRTYLTESLKRLLVGAARRLVKGDGDPVVQLQTNFGGGKTHSMLALYHLFSGASPSELPGVEDVLGEAEVDGLVKANRVVLVGNKISPGNPSVKPDGTRVRTLWGELAWQLGGREAYEKVRADDENATSPGDTLRELFNQYGPCLILVDEWVAYARQLHDQSDLPAGGFETQFTFAQALTESAKLSKNCLLVISLPASDTAGSPHSHADDVEVGGQRGREALDRLRNVVGRVESSWRPATAEEGFEIVRRRLFEPLIEKHQFVTRDLVAREFYDFYRTQSEEFPPECRDPKYEERLKAAYPIHPEVFDRLYTDWSTLVKFQRTRGVLRLMAAVIHTLWEQGDRNPLILPAHIPIDDRRVQFELTRYLSDNWPPIIEKDVDGPNSLPLRIDSDVPNLGRYGATKRVARTIYLGSAPTSAASNKGIEDRRIKLGCALPGESPAIFGDALRRLAGSATYLFQDGTRYWYSTQPTVTKLAEDRAEQYKRDPEAVYQELDRRLRADLRNQGDFCGIHPLPHSSQDVQDDLDARLVVLGPNEPYSRDANNHAEVAARGILEMRGNTPRLYRNSLVFLAVDRTRWQDLEEALRRYLAWKSVLDERESLDLSPFQVRQAETQLHAADSTVETRIPEAYQWLLVPEQASPQSPVTFQALRLTGQDALAVRASKKLRNDELLLVGFAATRLRMELDRVPLWRGNHVPVRQLVEDFAKYIYLPRLKNSDVLFKAIEEGMSMLTWAKDAFAYADSYDEAADRYLGLRGGQGGGFGDVTGGLLVKPDVARVQIEAEIASQPGERDSETEESDASPETPSIADPAPVPAKPQQPRRFHGTVELDSTRVSRDAGKIAEEVIAHLVGLVGAEVSVTLEIEANIPDGVPENVVRIVTENCRTLKFRNQGFEKE